MIELRPDRDLLDVNFGGYKLSLEPIPSYQHDIECGVDHVLPSDDQYSFLHQKVFSLHNHLYGDPWSQEDVYFIDKRWRVQRKFSKGQTSPLGGIRPVWEIPGSSPRQSGHYNPSLSFPDPQTAVVADGTGIFHIVVTGSRAEYKQWKAVFSEEVCRSQPFIIADSRFMKNDDKGIELHCLLLWVDESPRSENNEGHAHSSNFQSTLAWIVLKQGEGEKWSVSRSYRLAGPRDLHYIALEANCTALYVASEETVKFTEDSEKSIEPTIEPSEKTAAKEGDPEKKNYMWQQNVEGIEISFNLAEDVQKKEVVVDIQDKSLNITCRGRTLLAGEMWGCTDPSLSCWTLERNRLQITISKVESGLMWQTLVPTDSQGEEVVDPAMAEEVHQRLAHLCSDKEVTDTTHTPTFNSEQLEDCDTGQTNSVLLRLDPESHSTSHQASLGGHQALFSTRITAGAAPALCLRHDVDGCVWQPSKPKFSDLSTWPIAHIGTFHAFGYVQASKEQRKFSVCAPDLSYVAVCDASRHIYVYRQPVEVQGSLRNRRTGQKIAQTAQQQLVALPDTAEVLGAHAGNHTLFVLTACYILSLHVNP